MGLDRGMQRLSVVLATAIMALIASPGRADACTCVPPTIEASYNDSSDVVRARVLLELDVGPVTWHLALVTRTFKGCHDTGELVLLTSPSSSAACGIDLVQGWQYLIHGTEAPPVLGLPQMMIGSCDYNRPFWALSERDRRFLDGRMVCCGDSCECADGSEPVACLVDPCEVAPACPGATCIANYCGGCHAEQFDELGRPATCDAACESDQDCGEEAWCRQVAPADDPEAPAVFECVPFAVENESCNGFTLPWFYEQCEPGLVCDTPDALPDASGVCRRTCESASDCDEDTFCSADGVCRADGTCELDAECNFGGNDFVHPACAGFGVCDEASQQCGWECGPPQCLELDGMDLGDCDTQLGWGVTGGHCGQVRGCDDSGLSFFSSQTACLRACHGSGGREQNCMTDEDCMVTGCSGQVCAAEVTNTTCDWQPEYACYQDEALAACGCQAGGRCGWAPTPELAMCLANPPGN